jgi:hypothetical protein
MGRGETGWIREISLRFKYWLRNCHDRVSRWSKKS